MGDERIVAAMAASENDIAIARASATTLLTTVYAVQLEKAQELVDVPKCADALASALNGYCVRIITCSSDPDTTVWQLCVSAIKATFTGEFKAIHFEFTAANAVETARADAEMADANRPIEEIVSEKVNVAVQALKETLESEKKKLRPALTDAPISKPKPKSKPQANAKASSSMDASKPLKQTTLAVVRSKKDKPAKEKKGKARKDVVDAEHMEDWSSAKSKGKGKAKTIPAEKETAKLSDESG
ncbi:hypothetical protein B0H13DRAFT_2336904 [Mycena leptocephala]|nr:hypothetical protein B0H13DRAFT_2336904 [Mycena leptocephala]